MALPAAMQVGAVALAASWYPTNSSPGMRTTLPADAEAGDVDRVA